MDELGECLLKLIDEEGNLLGYVNIIDVLVLLFVSAVVIAGVSAVTTEESSRANQNVQSIVLLANNQPDYLANALTTGPVSDSDINAVEDILVQDKGKNNTILVELSVIVEVSGEGMNSWRGDLLILGRTVQVDLRGVRFNGVIVEIGSDIVLTPVDFGQ